MADKSKELYLLEYARISPCTAEENRELMKKKLSDSQAMNRLVEGNMFRVNEAASVLAKSGSLFMDLVQEGSLALFLMLSEAEEYTEEFEQQLDQGILDAMKEFLDAEEDSRKAGQELSDKLNLMDKACVLLAEKHGREATAEEVAEALEMEVDEVRYLMRIALNAIKKE